MPTITGVSPQAFGDGRQVTVTGSGFGAFGTVTIGGLTQPVSSWTDTSVVFTAVRGTQSMGPAVLSVVGANGVSGGTAALGWSAAALLAGQSLTITTDGTYNFGVIGPTVAVYHDFSGGTAGATVGNSDPQIGAWSGNGNYSAGIYASGGRDGLSCMSIFNTAYAGTGDTRKIRAKHVTFSNTAEVFVAWATKFPGGITGSGAANTWPTASHFKQIWVSNNNGIGGGDGNDIVLFSHSGGGANATVGNDSQETAYHSTAVDLNNYNFSGWNFYQEWLKGGASPTADPSTIYACFANANTKLEQTITNKKVFAATDGVINYVHAPGWWGNVDSAESGLNPLIDDIYIASGSGAAARVLLGDASTWTACRELWIAPPTAWGSTSVTCRLPSTGGSISGMYAYLFDSSNTRINSSGLQLA